MPRSKAPRIPKSDVDLLQYEKAFWAKGCVYVAGVDEAGRGCLVGNVVAAAVILPPHRHIEGVYDSKQLSAAQRDLLFDRIQEEAIALSIGACSPAEIDQLNILWAAMEAMRRAVVALPTPAQALLVDGNRIFPHCQQPHKTIVKGDALSHSIAAASIIAKVTRDRQMDDLHAAYPQYGFNQHKGYPTAQHYAALEKHGITPQHRQSFRLFAQETQLQFHF